MSIFNSEPTHVVITKRKTSRKIYVPNASSWRDLATEYPAKFFRFYDDRTEYTRGKLSVTFNLDGKAIEGWSYWTCIYCYAEPTDDFPQGRLIFNDSGYGNTTSKHISEMRDFFGSEDRVTVMRKRYTRVHRTALRKSTYSDRMHATQVYTREYLVSFDTDTVDPVTYFAAEQICWGRGATPQRMREHLRLQQRTPAQVAADAQAAIDAERARAERWAAMEAQWAAEAAAAERSAPQLTLVQGGA